MNDDEDWIGHANSSRNSWWGKQMKGMNSLILNISNEGAWTAILFGIRDQVLADDFSDCRIMSWREFLRFMFVKLIKAKQITFLVRERTKDLAVPVCADVFSSASFSFSSSSSELNNTAREKRLFRNAFWHRNNEPLWCFEVLVVLQCKWDERTSCLLWNKHPSLFFCFRSTWVTQMASASVEFRWLWQRENGVTLTRNHVIIYGERIDQ